MKNIIIDLEQEHYLLMRSYISSMKKDGYKFPKQYLKTYGL